jgi:hypothetical protein
MNRYLCCGSTHDVLTQEPGQIDMEQHEEQVQVSSCNDLVEYLVKHNPNITKRDNLLWNKYIEASNECQKYKSLLEGCTIAIYAIKKEEIEQEYITRNRHLQDEVEPFEEGSMQSRVLKQHNLSLSLYKYNYNRNLLTKKKLIRHFKERFLIEQIELERAKPSEFSMASLDRLPLDVVNIIQSYLPYEVLTDYLESQYKFLAKLRAMSARKTYVYLRHLFQHEDYSTANIVGNLKGTIYEVPVDVNIIDKTCISDRAQRIQFIYYSFRRNNIKAAWKMMRTFAILFRL